ncbi:MAG: hypothetical protein ACK5Y2_11915 [Bdellovibrionales bacterium]
MSESLSSKVVDPLSEPSKSWIPTENLNPEVIRRKQKSMLVYRVFAVAALVSIPVVINAFSRNSYAAWSTSAAVLGLGIVSFFMYRTQSRLKFQIDSACHQLGPGVKLRRKYLKDSTDLYQIFQEGHRYYYVQSLQTGEKRLVPKDKILQDYDLAI